MEKFPDFNSENKKEIVQNFEQMLKSDDFIFLEESSFNYLIEHYLEEGDYSKALTAAKVGNKQYPYSVDLLNEIASILIETGRSIEATEYIEKAELFSPNDIDVLMLKGVVNLDQDKFDEAIECFERLLPFAEDQSEVYYHLGMAYFGKEDTEMSIESFKKSIQLNSRNDDAVFDLVNVLDSLDMLEETLPFYEELIDEDPFNHVAWYNLGIVNDRLGNYQEAVDAYEYALAINEDFSSAYYNMACSYMALAKYSKAIEQFNESLKHENWNDVAVNVNIGHCYFELKDDAKAIECYHKALQIDHKNYLAYFGIGRSLERQEKWLESVHFLNKAAEFFPDDINIWLLLGKAEYNLGNVVAAITAYMNASDLEPEITEVWLDWSYVVYEQGNFEKALEVIDLGIDALPEEATLYYRAVVYLIKASKYKEAFLYLENALTLDFDKHAELFEFFPELETQKAIMKIIDQFSEGLK